VTNDDNWAVVCFGNNRNEIINMIEERRNARACGTPIPTAVIDQPRFTLETTSDSKKRRSPVHHAMDKNDLR